MKNIILIDYQFTSLDKLKKICDELNINFDVLKKDKEDFKLLKIWLDIDLLYMVAYTTIKRPNEIKYDGFEQRLLEMSRYSLKPTTDLSNLSIDSILDKISQFGINSLLKEEKEFLDNVSKG